MKKHIKTNNLNTMQFKQRAIKTIQLKKIQGKNEQLNKNARQLKQTYS